MPHPPAWRAAAAADASAPTHPKWGAVAILSWEVRVWLASCCCRATVQAWKYRLCARWCLGCRGRVPRLKKGLWPLPFQQLAAIFFGHLPVCGRVWQASESGPSVASWLCAPSGGPPWCCSVFIFICWPPVLEGSGGGRACGAGGLYSAHCEHARAPGVCVSGPLHAPVVCVARPAWLQPTCLPCMHCMRADAPSSLAPLHTDPLHACLSRPPASARVRRSRRRALSMPPRCT